MTTEFEGIKTSEFLRRRKLRLQQVREQSKDIAKKIRQRTKVEKLRQVTELDSKKEKEYLKHQEKLVKRLELLYAKGVSNVGAGHKQAADLTQVSAEKADLSRQRGREAAAELRKKRQEQLDKQKKILDRKLQAREAANEISRDKSTNVANKLLSKPSTSAIKDQSKDKSPNEDIVEDVGNNVDKEPVKHTDMATQWEYDGEPNEWEPVPALSLPKEDSEKESVNNNNTESKSDKSKRIDLFALSAEMPSSLRGGLTEIPEERVPVRPSFTQVSEYLQSRGLRLRETDKVVGKPTGELQSLKQTILRTRPSQTEGSMSNTVCHVLDEQVIPTPCWQAEPNCQFCSHKILHHYGATEITVTNSQINKIFSSIRSNRDLLPSPVLRGSSPFRRNKVIERLPVKGKPREKSPTNNSTSTVTTKRNSVTVYNHSTRDTRNIPCGEERLVVPNTSKNEDAYSQAMKESSTSDAKDREHQQRLQEMRSKIAMTKQNVEKEYNDTLSFLNSLPKEKGSKTIKTAYMDERREKMLKESRQHKLQQEFRKIEKECRKHGSMSSKKCSVDNRQRSKSPQKAVDLEGRDFQYSWMPVPESDGSLAIHTIPTTTKPKLGNSVKFSKVDSYHEYRSRHKHTPPTKEREQEPKTLVETVLIQENETSDSSSSDTSSIENLGLGSNIQEKKKNWDDKLTDAERIIIYKVLDSKKKERSKKKARLVSDIAKSLYSMSKDKLADEERNNNDQKNMEQSKGNVQETVSLEHIQEGIYKTTKEKGDNITSLYFTEKSGDGKKIILNEEEICHGRPCCCNKRIEKGQRRDAGTHIEWGKGDKTTPHRKTEGCMDCKCGSVTKTSERPVPAAPQPSAATSTSSFRTATTDKENPALPETGFVKVLDHEGQEAGKFYIGASGFLKDDDYEVIIQLRKKDSGKENKPNKSADDKLYTEAPQNEKPAIPTSDVVNNSETRSTSVNTTRKDIIEINNVATDTAPVDDTAILKTTSVAKEKTLETRPSTQDLSKSNLEKIISSNNISEVEDVQETNYADKGVGTSFQLSYTYPNHVTDPVPRPAASTYTQTSFSTPNPRPAYVHMSSSTSTAYMSPPEVVLPRCLRRDSDESTNKAFSSEFGRSDGHYKCNKKCTCFVRGKVTNMDFDNIPSRTMSKCVKKIASAPPNTARSYTASDDCDTMVKYKRHKCHRCASKSESDKYQSLNLRNGAPKKKANLPKHTISSVRSLSKKTRNLKKKDNNADFNPVIKNYVNKLLTLNQEGIKALEVANQECSSVATPGSSIIDVPRNVAQKPCVEPKLSLEHIKNELIKKILTDFMNKAQTGDKNDKIEHETNHNINIKVSAPRLPKKRSVHKVKSLNISKRLLKNKKSAGMKKSVCNKETIIRNILPTENPDIPVESKPCNKDKPRSKSSPTPRHIINPENKRKNSPSDISTKCSKLSGKYNSEQREDSTDCSLNSNKPFSKPKQSRASTAKLDSDASDMKEFKDHTAVSRNQENPIPISTQTSCHMDSETNYVKLAENKLQNMEKIADLTEKCTQRLSSLAKVLEEVRKNKSLAYSQISSSDSTSDADQQGDKRLTNINSNSGQSLDLDVDAQRKLELKPSTPALTSESEGSETLDSSKYVSFLTDIPKPLVAKIMPTEREIAPETCQRTDENLKTKSKPPPALSRLHLRHAQGYMTPHELSTVVEVDSPMSVRLKNSSRFDNKDMPESVDVHSNSNEVMNEISSASIQRDNSIAESAINPDLLQSNLSVSKTKHHQTRPTTDSSDGSKLQMMDLKQFNEIMLQPFISIQEYAKQYDIGTIDEASNLEDVPKDDAVNEELSSMQSDSSLPDVIAELLKRKIISEPFKFDTVSNIHSSTGSSESSVLALSKVRRDKKKSTVVFYDKENVAESSDTMSFSSNPDLENAFKKLGMGWASSTLKKTKERLALSSSSNTSTSSVSQFKIKNFNNNNQDVPVLVTDSMSSIMHLTRKEEQRDSKNNGQQTNLVKSMTVKEFLTNELADKITFTNKSRRDDTAEEFVSLFETKMPEEMKHSSQMAGDERSVDSGAGGNRARTSTPVQVFKSMTYHSSSSSNLSNGLFSNADDLSSVKVTSNSIRNHSTSDKDDLTIPNCSLRIKKASDASKSD